MKYLLTILLAATLGLMWLGVVNAQTGTVASASLTRVIDDNVPVFTRMATGGGVIHELSRDDRVAVQFEMEQGGRSWCSVVYKGETTLSGYVECRHLEQKSKQKKWELVKSSGGGSSALYTDSTPVRVINRQVLVPVSLNYKGAELPVELLLDTGASGTVIKSEVARRLGVNLENAINVKAVVMGGGTVDVKVVQLTNMSVGPHQMAGPVVGVIEHEGAPVNFDGVLGMDFLGEVDYQVDLDRQVITWTR